MRDPLAPVIEGVDLSGMVNKYSFVCEPFFTDRNETQTMLDGSTVHDVFPLKARFSWTLNALSAEQYAALNAAFNSPAAQLQYQYTVTAQIFDPTINAVRSARFHVTRPAFVYNFTTSHYMSTDGSALILEDAAPRALPSVTPTTRPAAANRDPLAPIIEGYDLSGMVNKYSFVCEPFTTDGDNAGTLQDGSTVLDVLANKFRLSWTLNAISAQQYADLCAVLSSGTAPDTVSASVYNPIIDARYITIFHVTFPVFRFVLDNGQCMACADSALALDETGDERLIIVDNGDWWTLYGNGMLDIYCVGNMPNYSIRSPSPWDSYKTQITSVTIRDSVTRIGEYAFYQCSSLTDVTIPDTVTNIGKRAFSGCSSLTDVTIPGSVLGVGENAFSSCSSLTNVTISDGVITLGRWAFNYCGNLTSVILPDSVTWLNSGTFENCTSLTEVMIPDSVTGIGYSAFENCVSLTSIVIPGSVNYMDSGVFRNCSGLTSATISDGVKDFGQYAFENCVSLTSVTIGNDVDIIRMGAFSGCTSLTNVTIPNSVAEIGDSAFANCSALTSATISKNVIRFGYSSFRRTSLTAVTINREARVRDNTFPSSCVINYY